MAELTNVINVTFGALNTAAVRVPWAYNHNAGVMLKPVGIDLPTAYQVHWALSPDASSSLETVGSAEDGVPIPDEMWESGKEFYGWFYLHPTEDSSVTRYEVKVLERRRAPLPTGTPTPAQQSAIDQAITALNSAVEQTAEDAADAAESADRAEQAAATSGYMFFYIDDNGDLIYERTENVEVDFELIDGDLYLEV